MREICLHPILMKKELDSLAERYHFSNTDYQHLKSLYEALQPLVRAKIFFERNPKIDFIQNDNYVIVIVTLGKYIDELEDLYSKSERFLEAYMIECLSLELLNRTYGLIEDIIYEETGLWQAGYDFLGDRYPIEKIGEVLEYFKETGLSCNTYYRMDPKKTVVYIADLTQNKREEPCNICENCGNKNCPNRRKEEVKFRSGKALSYGYQRIFERHHAAVRRQKGIQDK